ncbi:3739_t:CDS:2 [Entrophospora sp. SA101]|nr:7629_t:CDS:2 [Entrophospora sp. SA101]CAJ0864547.1 3739_t:CDS:2 [Entrophospora sp. SA101]
MSFGWEQHYGRDPPENFPPMNPSPHREYFPPFSENQYNNHRNVYNRYQDERETDWIRERSPLPSYSREREHERDNRHRDNRERNNSYRGNNISPQDGGGGGRHDSYDYHFDNRNYIKVSEASNKDNNIIISDNEFPGFKNNDELSNINHFRKANENPKGGWTGWRSIESGFCTLPNKYQENNESLLLSQNGDFGCGNSAAANLSGNIIDQSQDMEISSGGTDMQQQLSSQIIDNQKTTTVRIKTVSSDQFKLIKEYVETSERLNANYDDENKIITIDENKEPKESSSTLFLPIVNKVPSLLSSMQLKEHTFENNSIGTQLECVEDELDYYQNLLSEIQKQCEEKMRLNSDNQKIDKNLEIIQQNVTKSQMEKKSSQTSNDELQLWENIYAQNKEFLRERANSRFSDNLLLGPMKLYNDINDYPFFQQNTDKHNRLKIFYISNCSIEDKSKETGLQQEWKMLFQTWKQNAQNSVNSKGKLKQDDDSGSTVGFAARWPVRLNRGKRRTDVVRSDAEMQDILNQFAEAERIAKTWAKIPQMILGEKRREYSCIIDNNSFVLDPISFYEINVDFNVNWTNQEKETFYEQFKLYPKNFGKIVAAIENKSFKNCVLYYYQNKKALNLKELIPKNGRAVGQSNIGIYEAACVLTMMSLENGQVILSKPSQQQHHEVVVLPNDNNTSKGKIRPKQNEIMDSSGGDKDDGDDGSGKKTTTGDRTTTGSHHKKISSYWNKKEINQFEQSLNLYGRDFKRISEFIKTKSEVQVKNYYEKQINNNTSYIRHNLDNNNTHNNSTANNDIIKNTFSEKSNQNTNIMQKKSIMKISSTPPIATKVSSVQPATKNSVAFVLNETDEPISRYGHSNSSNGDDERININDNDNINKNNNENPYILQQQLQKNTNLHSSTSTSNEGNKQNILSPISSLTTQLQQYMTSEMARKQKDVVAQMTAQRRQQQTFFPSISNIIMPSTSNQQPQNIFLQVRPQHVWIDQSSRMPYFMPPQQAHQQKQAQANQQSHQQMNQLIHQNLLQPLQQQHETPSPTLPQPTSSNQRHFLQQQQQFHNHHPQQQPPSQPSSSSSQQQQNKYHKYYPSKLYGDDQNQCDR